jgi:hypothetical protein
MVFKLCSLYFQINSLSNMYTLLQFFAFLPEYLSCKKTNISMNFNELSHISQYVIFMMKRRYYLLIFCNKVVLISVRCTSESFGSDNICWLWFIIVRMLSYSCHLLYNVEVLIYFQFFYREHDWCMQYLFPLHSKGKCGKNQWEIPTRLNSTKIEAKYSVYIYAHSIYWLDGGTSIKHKPWRA